MKIQPITTQPNFNGKVVFETGTAKTIKTSAPNALYNKFKEISNLIQDKPYDLFISKNKQNPIFYNIAANKSFKEAQKVKEYTVKIQSDIFTESIVDAAKEAMNMYEEYIAKSIKR